MLTNLGGGRYTQNTQHDWVTAKKEGWDEIYWDPIYIMGIRRNSDGVRMTGLSCVDQWPWRYGDGVLLQLYWTEPDGIRIWGILCLYSASRNENRRTLNTFLSSTSLNLTSKWHSSNSLRQGVLLRGPFPDGLLACNWRHYLSKIQVVVLSLLWGMNT